VAWAEALKKYKTFYMPKAFPWLMPENRSIDIDDTWDLDIAEYVIRRSNGEEAPYKL